MHTHKARSVHFFSLLFSSAAVAVTLYIPFSPAHTIFTMFAQAKYNKSNSANFFVCFFFSVLKKFIWWREHILLTVQWFIRLHKIIFIVWLYLCAGVVWFGERRCGGRPRRQSAAELNQSPFSFTFFHSLSRIFLICKLSIRITIPLYSGRCMRTPEKIKIAIVMRFFFACPRNDSIVRVSEACSYVCVRVYVQWTMVGNCF